MTSDPHSHWPKETLPNPGGERAVTQGSWTVGVWTVNECLGGASSGTGLDSQQRRVNERALEMWLWTLPVWGVGGGSFVKHATIRDCCGVIGSNSLVIIIIIFFPFFPWVFWSNIEDFVMNTFAIHAQNSVDIKHFKHSLEHQHLRER